MFICLSIIFSIIYFVDHFSHLVVYSSIVKLCIYVRMHIHILHTHGHIIYIRPSMNTYICIHTYTHTYTYIQIFICAYSSLRLAKPSLHSNVVLKTSEVEREEKQIYEKKIFFSSEAIYFLCEIWTQCDIC